MYDMYDIQYIVYIKIHNIVVYTLLYSFVHSLKFLQFWYELLPHLHDEHLHVFNKPVHLLHYDDFLYVWKSFLLDSDKTRLKPQGISCYTGLTSLLSYHTCQSYTPFYISLLCPFSVSRNYKSFFLIVCNRK